MRELAKPGQWNREGPTDGLSAVRNLFTYAEFILQVKDVTKSQINTHKNNQMTPQLRWYLTTHKSFAKVARQSQDFAALLLVEQLMLARRSQRSTLHKGTKLLMNSWNTTLCQYTFLFKMTCSTSDTDSYCYNVRTGWLACRHAKSKSANLPLARQCGTINWDIYC